MSITVTQPDEQSRKLHASIVECQKWINNNYEELQRKYPNTHIAVHDKQVIDSDVDFQKLMRRLREQYWDIKHILIRFISKDKMTLVI